MNTHRELAQDWNDLASLDPLFAIVQDRARFKNLDLTDFLATGVRNIAKVMETAESLGRPKARGRALDFGCGVGQVTRALAGYFRECCGLDISGLIVEKAKQLNNDMPTCHFQINSAPNLRMFSNNSFDMIYSAYVLQHLPPHLTKRYVTEFIRVIKKNGLVVFQLPHSIKPIYRFRLRRRVYTLLRLLGFQTRLLVERLGLNPTKMYSMPEDEVAKFLEKSGARILAIKKSPPSAGSAILYRTYYLTK